jgi:hypothetical protein
MIFSSNIIKTPKSSRNGAERKKYWKREKIKKKERKRKRGRKRKALRVPSNKGEVNILRGEKHFNLKNPFWCDSIFSPSIIPFQKPF